MRRKYIISLIVLLAVVFAVPAWAKEDSSGQIASKSMEIKKDLRKVKSAEKKNTVDKISEELIALNNRKLEQFEKSLKQLESVLSRTLEKAEKRAQKGFNIDNVKAAVDAARVEIAASRTAIEAQKSKTYKIDAVADDKLKEAVKKVRKTLHADLKIVQDSVKKAREAVHEATKTLAKIRKNGRVTPTPTVSSSPATFPSASPGTTP